ncbi:MAG: LemA family protein [Thiovulaceae bacterium]|nr:LemA family protein [Sulfurimonadaceae bacterium]
MPNLVASVSQYIEFEKSTLEKVTQLRSYANKPNLRYNSTYKIDQETFIKF